METSMATVVLTTSLQDLFNAESDSDDQKIGRINSCYVHSLESSTDKAEIYINGQVAERIVRPGNTQYYSRQGKIYRVQGKLPDASALAATVDFSISGE
jgi:hypothetical protein